LCYFASAFIILFTTILDQPTDPALEVRLAAMEAFVQAIRRIIGEEGFDLKQMSETCSQMMLIARNTVEAAAVVHLTRHRCHAASNTRVSGAHSQLFRVQYLTHSGHETGSSRPDQSSCPSHVSGAKLDE
jgi:hypothetical protein